MVVGYQLLQIISKKQKPLHTEHWTLQTIQEILRCAQDDKGRR